MALTGSALLQACSRPEAFQPTRRMGGAAPLVASLQTMAVSGMEDSPQRHGVRRDGLG